MADGGLTCSTPLGTSYPIQPGQEQDCTNAGGQVGVVSSGGGGSICFVRDILTRALGEQILEIGGTYQLACRFRDEILSHSPIGRKLLDQYYASLPVTFAIVRTNPEIIFQAIKVWRGTWLVALAMVSLKDGSAAGTNSNLVTYSEEQHRDFTRLFEMLRAGTEDNAYLSMLDDVADKVKQRFAGRNAEEILKQLECE
jgi:hypothetical protein